MMPTSPLKESWSRQSHNKHVPRGHLSSIQSHLVAALGEFVGTFFFLWMAYSGQLMVGNQVASTAIAGGGASSETVVLISLVYGFSLLVNAWAFYRISGGLFNPAVSHFLFLMIGLVPPWFMSRMLIPDGLNRRLPLVSACRASCRGSGRRSSSPLSCSRAWSQAVSSMPCSPATSPTSIPFSPTGSR